MLIGRFEGLGIEVLTRDEHCPPHVHVDGDSWQARFEFAYWHDDVTLYSLAGKRLPSQRKIDNLCRMIEQPAVLRKARKAFWNAVHSVCLNNQRWDPLRNQVVDPKSDFRLLKITRATFHCGTEVRDGLLISLYETRFFLADSHITLQHST